MSASRTHLPRSGVVACLAGWMMLTAAIPATAGNAHPPEKPAAPTSLLLEGLPEAEAREAREVWNLTRERFTRITGRNVGTLPVRVQLVEHPHGGEASRTVSQVMGVAVQGPRECRISIGLLRHSSFGRVFAHELTHAFLREAYGRTSNQALSEGLAEYLASLSYSSEVNRDMRAAAALYVSSLKLQPYVQGYNFCLHYAGSPQFIEFFDRQVYMPDFGFDQLLTVWKKHTDFAPR